MCVVHIWNDRADGDHVQLPDVGSGVNLPWTCSTPEHGLCVNVLILCCGTSTGLRSFSIHGDHGLRFVGFRALGMSGWTLGHLKKLHTRAKARVLSAVLHVCVVVIVVAGSVIFSGNTSLFYVCEDVLLIIYNNKFEEKILSYRIAAPRSDVCIRCCRSGGAEEKVKKWCRKLEVFKISRSKKRREHPKQQEWHSARGVKKGSR